MIPFRKRGMYQALQNGMYGFGAICGASFGGSIADSIGWRWCFLIQVPISAIALFLGWLVIKSPVELHPTWKEIKARVDFSGSLLLVVAVSVQLVGLSLGGNELPWSNPWVIGSLVASVVLLGAFFLVEAKTTAIPVIPLRQLRGRNPIAIQTANVCAGTAAYAVSNHACRYWSRANYLAVPLYASPVLPGRPARFCYKGWCASCDPFPCDPNSWTGCGHRHVVLGETNNTRQNRRAVHDSRERVGDFSILLR